jgi:hypothetical protein
VQRGRGWQVWPNRVELEPPFRPVWPQAARSAVVDDARKTTFMRTWLDGLFGRPAKEAPEPIEEVEPEPKPAVLQPIRELQLTLGPDVKVSADIAEHFLLSLTSSTHPVSFEILGTAERITVQLACAVADVPHVREQARAYFPDALVSETYGVLVDTWNSSSGATAIVDFGLSQEFMRPLKVFSRFDADPLIGVLGALSDLEVDEIAVLQVLWQAARAPWSQEIQRSVLGIDGEPFFIDAPELTSMAADKVQRPLFAVCVRVAAKAADVSRSWDLARRLGATLSQLANPASNELIALSNEDYPVDEHVADCLHRRSHRSGMLLNTEELVSLVHPPSSAVRSPRLQRVTKRTKAAPQSALGNELVLGTNTHNGRSIEVSLNAGQRLKHVHLVGASGSGKSTLLLQMVLQDIQRGAGVAVLDPHGDVIDEILGRVPEHRVDDVVLFDASDEEFPIGFNILSARSELEKTLLASDLVAAFRRLSTSWGDQMTSVLGNAILAFLESTQGGTLADLRRFLVEPDFRTSFLKTVTDQEIVYYWTREFPVLTGRPQAPLLTRLDTFLRPRLVRHMVNQREDRLDFRQMMDGDKILLAKLAQGAIGEENAYLLGTLLVTKFHQMALGRQNVPEAERRPFTLIIDEAHNFITPSLASILSGARKFGLGLVLSHQELRQLLSNNADVAAAVLANPYTRICFRLGDDDAKRLAPGFSSFEPQDFQNLGVGEAIVRMGQAEHDFTLITSPLPPVDADVARVRREQIVANSRECYARPRAEIEAALHHARVEEPPAARAKDSPRRYGPPPKRPQTKKP